MKYKKLAIGGIFILMIAIIFYLLRQGYASLVTAGQYAEELTVLQTGQAKTEQNKKILLAQQLGLQAKKINVYDNSNHMIAELLAVQSMKLLPTVEASQVLQFNLSASELSRIEQDAAVLTAAFSPDGKFVATGSSDNIVRILETSTGQEVLQMHHENTVQSVTFSPNGKYIATASLDNTIRIWDAATGKELMNMEHVGIQLSIVYGPNGEYIVSYGSDRTVRVWDTTTGDELAYLLHEDSVTSIAFSPDNKHIATGSNDNIARVWDVTTGKEIARATHNEAVTAVAFSPDGKYVISGSKDSTAQTWNAFTGEGVALTLDQGAREAVSIIRCPAPVTSVAFSPDGKYLAIGSEESKSAWMSGEISPALNVWKISPDNWEDYMRSMPLRSNVTAIVFSPDSQYLLSSSEDHTARVWEIVSGQELSRMTHDDAITSIAFSPDSKQVLSGSLDHTARIWEPLLWQKVTQGHHETLVTSIAFGPDSKYVASSEESGTILIRETETGREVAHTTLDAPPAENDDGIPFYGRSDMNYIHSIAFSPDGKYIVSDSIDNTIYIWDAKTLREIKQLKIDYKIITPYTDGKPYYSRGINAVAFSPDGKYVASGDVNGTIHVWEVNSGQEFAQMAIEEPVDGVNYYYSNSVLSVNFSPDGKYVVSGSWDNTVRIWEIATELEVRQLKQEDKIARLTEGGGEIYVSPKVNSVAFSPNGQYVVSGSESKTVYLWNVDAGQEIWRMERSDFPYSNDAQGKTPSVAFNHDGKYIIAASDDNTISIWDVATGKEFSRIQNIYGYDKQVTFAAISPDGKYVASGDSRGDVNLWLWRPDDLIADACSRLPRNLTRDEWTKYIGDYLPYQAVCPNLPIEQ